MSALVLAVVLAATTTVVGLQLRSSALTRSLAFVEKQIDALQARSAHLSREVARLTTERDKRIADLARVNADLEDSKERQAVVHEGLRSLGVRPEQDKETVARLMDVLDPSRRSPIPSAALVQIDSAVLTELATADPRAAMTLATRVAHQPEAALAIGRGLVFSGRIDPPRDPARAPLLEKLESVLSAALAVATSSMTPALQGLRGRTRYELALNRASEERNRLFKLALDDFDAASRERIAFDAYFDAVKTARKVLGALSEDVIAFACDPARTLDLSQRKNVCARLLFDASNVYENKRDRVAASGLSCRALEFLDVNAYGISESKERSDLLRAHQVHLERCRRPKLPDK